MPIFNRHYLHTARKGLLAVAAAAVVTAPLTASAFTLPERIPLPSGGFNSGLRWAAPGMTLSFNIPDPGGANRWNSAFADAVARWEAVVAFNFTVVDAAAEPCALRSGTIDQTDGISGAGFRNSNCLGVVLGSEVLAVTLVVVQPDSVLEEAIPTEQGPVVETIETDIVFNSDKVWDVYDSDDPDVPGTVDFRRVAVHELGHVMGLAHVADTDPPAIMRANLTATEYPQSDDIRGVNRRYPSLPDGPAAACRSAIALNQSQSVAGRVDGTCTRSDFVGGGELGPATRYRFSLAEAGAVTVRVEGAEGYETSVALYAANSGTLLGSGRAGVTSVVRRSLPAGSYDAVVTGDRPGSDGNFSVLATRGGTAFAVVPVLNLLLGDEED